MGKAAVTTQITATPKTVLKRILASLLFTWIGVCARCVNPTLPLTWTSTGSIHARGRRVVIVVGGLIPESHAVLVKPAQRLLKQARLRVTRRHGSFDDVELVLVHVNSRESPGFVGVRKLHLMPFDLVDDTPHKERQLGVPFHELP